MVESEATWLCEDWQIDCFHTVATHTCPGTSESGTSSTSTPIENVSGSIARHRGSVSRRNQAM